MRFHKVIRFSTKVPAIIGRMNRVLGWRSLVLLRVVVKRIKPLWSLKKPAGQSVLLLPGHLRWCRS
jgi:hypothetical protein